MGTRLGASSIGILASVTALGCAQTGIVGSDHGLLAQETPGYYPATVATHDEDPPSVNQTVRSSEPGVVVVESFSRELPAEAVDRRRLMVSERVRATEAADDRSPPDAIAELERHGSELVRISFALPEEGLPSVTGIVAASAIDRAGRVAERNEAVLRSQRPVVAELRSLGVRSIGSLWIANIVTAEMPASEARTFLERHPEVSASLNAPMVPEWNGTQYRASTGPAAGRMLAAGFNGDPAGTARYRLAMIEGQPNNWPSLQNHPDFRESSTDSTTRIQNVEDCNTCVSTFLGICNGWACVATADRTAASNHGNRTTHIAMGSIEQGQDSTVTSTTERVLRSGVANEVVADYYGITDCDAVARALQAAVSRGTDVVNMSIGTSDWGGGFCNRSGNCGGLNEVIRNSANAGMVIVKSAGNTGGSSCGLTYPAWRPEVISVGALAGPIPSTPGTSNYSTTPRADFSSRGGMTIRYTVPFGTFTDTMSGVGLMTWGQFQVWPQSGSPTFNTVVWDAGTSFAAPQVAGIAVTMVHSMSPDGVVHSPGQALSNMLVLGDGTDGAGASAAGVTDDLGFGRIRASTGSGSVLTAPWGWGSRTITGSTGVRTYTVGSAGAEPSGTREWRWATASVESNLDALQTDYSIQVVDACPPGGGRVVVASDESFDIRKRIELTQAQICPAGRPTCRCLEMEVLVHAAGPSGVTIHSTDFYHGGDPNVF